VVLNSCRLCNKIWFHRCIDRHVVTTFVNLTQSSCHVRLRWILLALILSRAAEIGIHWNFQFLQSDVETGPILKVTWKISSFLVFFGICQWKNLANHWHLGISETVIKNQALVFAAQCINMYSKATKYSAYLIALCTAKYLIQRLQWTFRYVEQFEMDLQEQ